MSEGNKIIYDDGTWTIDLRARNNIHVGEPNVRVWIWRKNYEVAKSTDKYRGYGHYTDHEELIPPEISGAARLAWSMLKENVGKEDEITEDLKTALAEFVQKTVEAEKDSEAESAE